MTLIFLFCLTLLRLFLSHSPTRSIFLFFPFCVSPLSVFHPIKPLELTANQLWKWPALLKSRLTMLLSDKRFTKPSFPDTYPLGCQGKRPPFRCLRNKTRLTGNDASDITISKPSERMFHGNKSTYLCPLPMWLPYIVHPNRKRSSYLLCQTELVSELPVSLFFLF